MKCPACNQEDCVGMRCRRVVVEEPVVEPRTLMTDLVAKRLGLRIWRDGELRDA